VNTLTEVNVRIAFLEPQCGQRGSSPCEYSAIEARTSKGAPQSWQT